MRVAKTLRYQQHLFEEIETRKETEHLIISMHSLRGIIACGRQRPQMHGRGQLWKEIVGNRMQLIAY